MQSRQIPEPLRPPERRCRLRAAVLLGVLIAANAAAVSFPGRVPNDQEVPSLAPMLEQVAPAVVSVATFAEHVSNPLMDDPFFRRFFDSAQQLQRARTQPAGSGVIFDARRGYVVTNNHVIDRAEEITVTLSDGRVLLAKLIGVDPQLDLAVLQIGADHLSQVALVDSATRVGDFVVAIGNPFGLGRTVTTGVVSALGRGAFAPEHYEDFIQTDASINSGNSGGALVDLRGDLVGINVAMLAPAGGNVGIGFAIPSTIVSAIASRLIEHGVVQHGSLGLSAAAFNAQLAKSFNVDAGNGVVVVAVEKDSGAARAGIVPGDVIVEIDGHRTDQVADFYARSALVMVGDSVKLTLRRGGKSMTVTIDVAAAYR